jgi:hypothetical protein
MTKKTKKKASKKKASKKKARKPKLPKIYVVDESDGCETWFDEVSTLLVPHETLSAEIKEAVDPLSGDDRPWKWSTFPVIYLTEVLEILQENGLLEPLIEKCRKTAKRLEEEEKEKAEDGEA